MFILGAAISTSQRTSLSITCGLTRGKNKYRRKTNAKTKIIFDTTKIIQWLFTIVVTISTKITAILKCRSSSTYLFATRFITMSITTKNRHFFFIIEKMHMDAYFRNQFLLVKDLWKLFRTESIIMNQISKFIDLENVYA